MEFETASNPIEIQHWGKYDILINRRLPDQKLVNEICAKMKQAFEERPEADLLRDWVVSKSYIRLRLDSRIDPKFCAKPRMVADVIGRDLRNKDNAIVGITRWLDISIKEAQAYDSLMSELALYSRLRQMVLTNDFQKVVIQRGFSRLETIDPLVGFVERDTYKKVIVYKYLDGVALGKSYICSDLEKINIASELKALFLREGIVAEDLEARQFIVTREGDDKVLNLIDLEGYHAIPKSQQKEA